MTDSSTLYSAQSETASYDAAATSSTNIASTTAANPAADQSAADQSSINVADGTESSDAVDTTNATPVDSSVNQDAIDYATSGYNFDFAGECPPTPQPVVVSESFQESFSEEYSAQSSENSQVQETRTFNGQEYTLDSKNSSKSNKVRYRNSSLPGGSRVADFNPITGTFKTHSPVALDLDGSGRIETTGASTAKNRSGSAIGKTVAFDIDGDGSKENIEWMSGSDGLLVDDRDGNAAQKMNGNRLFGDAGGQFSSGYEKLALLDVDGDGVLAGSELSGIKVWQDNGDARVQKGEMKSLADVGVDGISTQRHDVVNASGENLMQSVAQQNGKSILTEDVWFGQA